MTPCTLTRRRASLRAWRSCGATSCPTASTRTLPGTPSGPAASGRRSPRSRLRFALRSRDDRFWAPRAAASHDKTPPRAKENTFQQLFVSVSCTQGLAEIALTHMVDHMQQKATRPRPCSECPSTLARRAAQSRQPLSAGHWYLPRVSRYPHAHRVSTFTPTARQDHPMRVHTNKQTVQPAKQPSPSRRRTLRHHATPHHTQASTLPTQAFKSAAGAAAGAAAVVEVAPAPLTPA